MKRVLCMVCTVVVGALLLANHALAQSAPKWEVTKAWGYIQFQSDSAGFTIKRLRLIPTVTYDHWRLLTEIQVGLSTTLLRAQGDYWLYSVPVFDSIAIRGGQFTNMMAFLEQGPDTKPYVQYGLIDHYISRRYELGVTLVWVKGWALGQVQFVNGAGWGVPDDNHRKDVIIYVKGMPDGWLTYQAGVQTGHQPDGYRSVGYLHADILPIPAWTIQAGLVAEKYNTENRGWYISNLYSIIPPVRLTVRVLQRTQWEHATLAGMEVTDALEYTAGLWITLGPLQLQPNWIMARDRHPELAGVAQLNIVLK
ncbi:MAG: hypothetical protein V1685_02900 [Parcubacteria group bacterium]